LARNVTSRGKEERRTEHARAHRRAHARADTGGNHVDLMSRLKYRAAMLTPAPASAR
jgi:hypothetical protein